MHIRETILKSFTLPAQPVLEPSPFPDPQSSGVPVLEKAQEGMELRQLEAQYTCDISASEKQLRCSMDSCRNIE